MSQKISIGDYVHASRWSDQDPDDPWCVGHVTKINGDRVVVGLHSTREWPHWEKITGDQGYKILKERGVI